MFHRACQLATPDQLYTSLHSFIVIVIIAAIVIIVIVIIVSFFYHLCMYRNVGELDNVHNVDKTQECDWYSGNELISEDWQWVERFNRKWPKGYPYICVHVHHLSSEGDGALRGQLCLQRPTFVQIFFRVVMNVSRTNWQKLRFAKLDIWPQEYHISWEYLGVYLGQLGVKRLIVSEVTVVIRISWMKYLKT